MLAVACSTMFASTIKAREATEALTAGLVEDLASNPALRALYGTPFDLATPGGFTVWRLGMFVSAAACTWGLLTATRLLRGEEEAGRAELVHTAPISHPSITNITLLVIAAAAPFVGVFVALAFLGTAQEVAGSMLFSAGVTLLMLVFIATGGLTSQLFATRRRASGAGGIVLGAFFLLRMVADGSSGLGWLRWLTPFGWLEELRPFADNRAFRCCCWPLSQSPSARSRSRCPVSATSATGSCASVTPRRCKPACCAGRSRSSGVKAPADSSAGVCRSSRLAS